MWSSVSGQPELWRGRARRMGKHRGLRAAGLPVRCHAALLLLLLLSVFSCIPGTFAQTEVSKRSDVCQAPGTSACSAHLLTCSPGSTLVVLGADQAYLLQSFSPQSSCSSNPCPPAQCCTAAHFACSKTVRDPFLSQLLVACWGKQNCTIPAQFDQDQPGNASCSAELLLSSVFYLCVPDASIRTFGDSSTTTSTTALARFSESDESVENCIRPNMSLVCEVMPQDNGNLTDLWYTLILEQTTTTPCSTLALRVGGGLTVSSGVCRASFVYTSNQFSFTGSSNVARLEVTFQPSNPPRQFWVAARVGGSPVRVTCGKGTCTPTRKTTSPPFTETTSPPFTETTSPPFTETTSPLFTETTSPPFTETTSPPFTETTSVPTDSSTPELTESGDVSLYIVIIAVLVALCVGLIISLIVVVLRLRRRPGPRDSTYSIPVRPVQEERQYASLNNDAILQSHGLGGSSGYLNPVAPQTDPNYLNPVSPERDPNYLNPASPERDPNYLNPVSPERDPNYLNPVSPERDPNYLNPVSPERDPNYLNPVSPERDPKYSGFKSTERGHTYLELVPTVRGYPAGQNPSRPEVNRGSDLPTAGSSTDRLYEAVD